MYPRYRETFDTSKDPYYQLLLGLVYGRRSFPQNSLIEETLDEIIEAVRGNLYYLKNPDGSRTTYGNMIGFIPIFRSIKGIRAYSYYFALVLFPVYAFIRQFFYDAKYFNLLMMASHYLIYHLHRKGSRERAFLRLSINLFALVEKKNPYFLMIRDLINGSRTHRREVENILMSFPETHLPDDEEPLAHLDVLWQRDPRTWKNRLSQLRYEYSGVDYLLLYQFYLMHYREK
jgi:hypothetical protein